MINLFENYSQGSWDLHYSLIVAGYVNTTVCLSDDGFLPSDVTSPYLLIRNVVIFIMRILLTNVWLKPWTGMMSQDACA